MVTISRLQSSDIKSEASTRLPLTFPATVAFANPDPMSLATSSTVIGWSNSLIDLSGSVI